MGWQWSGTPSSSDDGRGAGSVLWVWFVGGALYKGLGVNWGPWRPGKQMTARYQWALRGGVHAVRLR